MAELLIVDDGDSIREVLRQLFEYEGHEVRVAGSGMQALQLAAANPPDVTFLDVKLPGMDGLEVLDRLRVACPESQVVMISGHGTIATALEATRRGAYDFLEKPLDTDRLLVTLRNALQLRGLSESVALLRSEVDKRHEIVGASPAIRRVLERVERVAPTDARVLVTGDNGTGKELVARAIHRLSPRAAREFVELNCAAIPTELIESELFGHVRGSFTGAIADRAGKFEQADRGTLFLDEIGDMSMSAQAKVLRALEVGHVTRVGGQKTKAVDVRVIAATNKDLAEEIEAGSFREDLFYRLNVVPVHVPPLRERREDIPMLVRHFQTRIESREGLPRREIEPRAVSRLMRLDWPGNVRELRNTVERLLILASGDSITVEEVEAIGSSDQARGGLGTELLAASTFQEFRERSERAFLAEKLKASEWNVSETARLLEMPRSNLYKRIERFGLRRGS